MVSQEVFVGRKTTRERNGSVLESPQEILQRLIRGASLQFRGDLYSQIRHDGQQAAVKGPIVNCVQT
jgi:ribose 1,5-bisphosphokinase PhnN